MAHDYTPEPGVAEQDGYDACYDGFKKSTNPYPMSSDAWATWREGYIRAEMEMEQESYDDREDFDSGRWTEEDERSMNAGPDLPMRNEAGEWMEGTGRGW